MASLRSSSAGDDTTSGAAACGTLTGALTVLGPAEAGARCTAEAPTDHGRAITGQKKTEVIRNCAFDAMGSAAVDGA